MSEIGIQAISDRAAADPAFASLLRSDALRALEGYDLTLEEHKSLEVLVVNGWRLPGEGPGPDGPADDRPGCRDVLLDLLFGKADRPARAL